MARLPRLAVADMPHLVLQRGNGRQAVFADDADRAAYRDWLRVLAPVHGVAIHAYVLMPDHVHLVLTPRTGPALGQFMQAMGRQYVRNFNRRHGRSGGLWEGRFKSAVFEAERYLLPAMLYVETNPVRAGLVADPSHYAWSSFAHHSGLSNDPVVSDHSLFWRLGNTPYEREVAYRVMQESGIEPEGLAALREATRYGWALGGPEFVEEVGRVSLRRAMKLSRGRRSKTR